MSHRFTLPTSSPPRAPAAGFGQAGPVSASASSTPNLAGTATGPHTVRCFFRTVFLFRWSFRSAFFDFAIANTPTTAPDGTPLPTTSSAANPASAAASGSVSGSPLALPPSSPQHGNCFLFHTFGFAAATHTLFVFASRVFCLTRFLPFIVFFLCRKWQVQVQAPQHHHPMLGARSRTAVGSRSRSSVTALDPDPRPAPAPANAEFSALETLPRRSSSCSCSPSGFTLSSSFVPEANAG